MQPPHLQPEHPQIPEAGGLMDHPMDHPRDHPMDHPMEAPWHSWEEREWESKIGLRRKSCAWLGAAAGLDSREGGARGKNGLEMSSCCKIYSRSS